LTGVSPLDASGLLAALSNAGIDFVVFGHQVRFCGYEHLVAMKEAAGRPEDLLDLERLRQARGE
jgi:hypothetical protein